MSRLSQYHSGMNSIAEMPEEMVLRKRRKTPLPSQSAKSRLRRTPLSRSDSRGSAIRPKGQVRELTLRERVALLRRERQFGRGFLITELESDSADSEDFDTDLEEDPEVKSPLRNNKEKLYAKACTQLGVTPASYFLRHIDDEHLKMAHHSLGPKGTQAMSYPLQITSSMSKLDLEDNGMEDQGAHFMARMLQENVYLTDLNLSENILGSLGLQALTETLKDNIFLRRIDLSGNGFKDKDAEYLADIIDTNRYLLELNLSHNELSSEAGIILKPAIAGNDTLEILDLSWNHFRLKGAQAIAEALASNDCLKCLRLNMNGFAVTGTISLGRALMFNKTLEELDISHNRITTLPLVDFAKGLQYNSTLKILKMGYNSITFQGTIAILKACMSKKCMVEFLDLEDILVNSSFCDMVKKLQLERHFQVATAGTIKERESYRNRISKLEEKNPLEVLLEFMVREDLRLVDLFKSLDKDQSMTLTREEFIKGLESLKTPLSVAQLDTLIEMLDTNRDGVVELGEILSINKKYKDVKMKAVRRILDEKQLKKDKEKAAKERAKLVKSGHIIETAETAMASLAEQDRESDDELLDAMDSFLNDSSGDEENDARLSSIVANVERSRNDNSGAGVYSRESTKS